MGCVVRRLTRGIALEIDGVEIPPRGKAFEKEWVGVITFDGDKSASIDGFHDNYTLLIQLGLAQ